MGPQHPAGSGRANSAVWSGTAAISARRSANSLPGPVYRMSLTPIPQVTRSGSAGSRGSWAPITSRGSAPDTDKLSTRHGWAGWGLRGADPVGGGPAGPGWVDPPPRLAGLLPQGSQDLADVPPLRARRAEPLGGGVAEDDPQRPIGVKDLLVVRAPVGSEGHAVLAHRVDAIGPPAERPGAQSRHPRGPRAGQVGPHGRDDLDRGAARGSGPAARAGQGQHPGRTRDRGHVLHNLAPRNG